MTCEVRKMASHPKAQSSPRFKVGQHQLQRLPDPRNRLLEVIAAVDKAIFHEELQTETIERSPFKREQTFPLRFVYSDVLRGGIGKANLQQ